MKTRRSLYETSSKTKIIDLAMVAAILAAFLNAAPLSSFGAPLLREIASALRSSLRRVGTRVDRTV
jgi:hypothetical protein